MKFSKFGQKFTQPTGISQLMDDLGDALKSDQPVNMLGGGNPAKIDAVNELFLETYKALGNDNDAGEANSSAIISMANYSNPQGDVVRCEVPIIMTVKEANQGIDKGRITLRIRVVRHANNRAAIGFSCIIVITKCFIRLQK